MLNTNCQIVDAERNDVSAQYPDVLKAIMANFTRWHESIMHSIDVESKCNAQVPDFKTRSFYDEGERLNITRMHRTDFRKTIDQLCARVFVALQHARKDRSQDASRVCAIHGDRLALETTAANRLENWFDLNAQQERRPTPLCIFPFANCRPLL